MTTKRYLAHGSEIAARMLGGEMIIMSARDSRVFTLNEVATVIWEAADGATALDEIVANVVCEQYDVTPDIALQDAEKLVQELVTHGIMLVSERPFTLADAPPREAP